MISGWLSGNVTTTYAHEADVIIFDEVHEAQLDNQLALYIICRYLKRVNRPWVRLLLMSATIDLEHLTDYLHIQVIIKTAAAFVTPLPV